MFLVSSKVQCLLIDTRAFACGIGTVVVTVYLHRGTDRKIQVIDSVNVDT